MNITVMGTGYVGLTVGTCLAELGNTVTCVDIDKKKIGGLNKGIIPIYEPGLAELVRRNVEKERLAFTTDSAEAIASGEVIFIAVGTPPGKDERADLRYVLAAAKEIGQKINGYKVIVTKSTVPVGTGDLVADTIRQHRKTAIDFDVVSNPEFLREGEAVNDFLNPDRIVVGTTSERARKAMEKLYAGIVRANKPILFTDVRTSEMIKYASNAMLATRISFMNEIAQLCEKVGADVKDIAWGMGLDGRIGPRFLQAGAGYGGSCFPKDVKALMRTMQDNGMPGLILDAVEKVNEMQKHSIVPKVKQLVPHLKGKTIAVWGLAFKPKTDDMREAPSLIVIPALQKEGASVRAYDPEAEKVATSLFSDVAYFKTPYGALKDADCLVVLTEWNEFREIDKEKMKSLLKEPNIVDGRNVYAMSQMREMGFNYIGVGRGNGNRN